MTDEMGAIGDVATGAMVARAVEPSATGHAAPAGIAGHTAERACLNCGTALHGAHCHACGQRAHVHRTIGAFAHDLLHGVLHFEGKTWRTLPLLVWKPGKLTREYIDGKRASYVSPIALFLFVVFLSFAAFNALGAGDAIQTQGSGLEEAREAYEDNAARLETLQQKLTSPEAADVARRRETAEEIKSLRDDQNALRMVLGNVSSDFQEGFSEGFERSPIPSDSSLGKALAHIRDNPQLAIYKAQTNAYKYSWMLIPLSVPFVWLLFPFSRRFGAYDHTVFATYSIGFMIALVAVASLFFYAGWGGIGGLLLLYAPLHMYRQLRGTYDLGRIGAGWRMLMLSLFAWVSIGLFASLIGVLTA